MHASDPCDHPAEVQGPDEIAARERRLSPNQPCCITAPISVKAWQIYEVQAR